MAKKINFRTLSAYTIAANCTDVSDCKVGLSELNSYLANAEKPCNSAYIRFYKLRNKLEKLESKAKKNAGKA